jgi:predicted PurR-regulated permease PerM
VSEITETAATAAVSSGRRDRGPVIRVRTLVAAALLVLAIVALLILLAQVANLVLLFLIAVVIAEGMRPLVHRLEQAGLQRFLAIIGVYIAFLLVLAIAIAILVQPVVAQAENLASHFPEYQKSAVSVITTVEHHLNITSTQLESQVQKALGTAGQVLVTIGGDIVSVCVNLVLVLVLSFLWLASSDRLKVRFVDLFPPHSQSLVADVLHEIGFRMGGYLRAVAINMVAVGVTTGVACLLLGLPSPVLLGLFAGITAAIPLFGPFLGVVPAVLLGFTVSPEYPILVLAVLLVIQLIDANTIVPMVMNRVLALPALAVVVALLAGAALAGLVGALLAVPIASAIQVLVVRVLVPYIHHTQGRADPTFASAFTAPPPAASHSPTARGER